MRALARARSRPPRPLTRRGVAARSRRSLQRGLAFNAYGEVMFVLLQNVVLLLLIYRHAPPRPGRTAALWGVYAAAVAAYAGGAWPRQRPH